VVSAKTAIIETHATGKTRRFNWPRIFGYDFFISFKLGPPPIGAQSYASDLARRLRELDFTVFFSEEEAPPGAKLDSTLVKALHKSRILVVIANESSLLHSPWIRREVEEFRRKHPSRPVIPINVDHAIEKFGTQADAANWLAHEGKIWLDERKRAIESGITTPEVLNRLEITPQFIRSNTRFRWAVALVILLLIGLASWAGFAAWDAKRKFRDATALRLVSEGGAMTAGLRPGGTIKGLFKVLAGHRLSRSANTDEALQTEYLKFRQLIFLRQQSAPILAVAISPDGKRIVSGSWDKTLRLWDADTGQPVGQPLAGHSDWVNSVAFSPNRQRIVSGSFDNTLRLWNADTGLPIGQPLAGHSDWVFSVAFSPDGQRIVSGSKDKTLRLWDAGSGQPIDQPLVGHLAGVSGVAFSPDGKRIVSGSWDNTLGLWDADTGQTLAGHLDRVSSVAFSPDGQRIVSGNRDGTLRLWDAEIGLALGQPLAGHSASVNSVAFNSDGKRIVSGSSDNTLRLWDAGTGKPVGRPLTGHSAWVSDVAFSPDGQRIVSGSEDNTLRLWDAETGAAIGQPLAGHLDRVNSVAFSPDGKRIVSGSGEILGNDNTLRLWPVFESWADELCKKLGHNMSHKEWREWVSSDIDYIEQCPGLPIPPDEPETSTAANEQIQP